MRAICSLVVEAAADILVVVVVDIPAVEAGGVAVRVAAVEVVPLTSVVAAVRPTSEAEVAVFLTLAGVAECMRRPMGEAPAGNREVGSLRTSIVLHRSVSHTSADSHTWHVRSNPQIIWEREHNRERVREEFSRGA